MIKRSYKHAYGSPAAPRAVPLGPVALLAAMAAAGACLGTPATAAAHPGPSPAVAAAPARAATVDALPRVTYAAHRGGSLEVPENSMSGLREALRRGTAQVLDVDVRMLGDGTLVAMHDATLDRTTPLTGPVRDLTAQDWADVRLDASRWFSPDWADEAPPTAEQVLDAFGGRVVLMLEAKDPESLPALEAMIEERGLERSVLVNTNRVGLAREIHERGLLTQLWRSKRQLAADDPAAWRSFVDLLDVDYRAGDAALERAVRSGIPRVWAHTVNTRADRDRALRLGCTGIITDAPGYLTGMFTDELSGNPLT